MLGNGKISMTGV